MARPRVRAPRPSGTPSHLSPDPLAETPYPVAPPAKKPPRGERSRNSRGASPRVPYSGGRATPEDSADTLEAERVRKASSRKKPPSLSEPEACLTSKGRRESALENGYLKVATRRGEPPYAL